MKVKVGAYLSPDKLRELLRYCPETGHFYWKLNRRGHVQAGQLAGRIANHGYRRIGYLDHINGVKDDNRITNLREVTQTENMQNIRRANTNNHSSGLLGASWNGHNGKWKAYIGLNNKKFHIGYFETAEEAHQAYLRKKAEIHTHSEL